MFINIWMMLDFVDKLDNPKQCQQKRVLYSCCFKITQSIRLTLKSIDHFNFKLIWNANESKYQKQILIDIQPLTFDVIVS